MYIFIPIRYLDIHLHFTYMHPCIAKLCKVKYSLIYYYPILLLSIWTLVYYQSKIKGFLLFLTVTLYPSSTLSLIYSMKHSVNTKVPRSYTIYLIVFSIVTYYLQQYPELRRYNWYSDYGRAIFKTSNSLRLKILQEDIF